MVDRIAKVLKKISAKDRVRLRDVLIALQEGNKMHGADIRKLANSDLYRLRTGRFRIIFHKERGDVVIDSVTMRNEKTYKDI